MHCSGINHIEGLHNFNIAFKCNKIDDNNTNAIIDLYSITSSMLRKYTFIINKNLYQQQQHYNNYKISLANGKLLPQISKNGFKAIYLHDQYPLLLTQDYNGHLLLWHTVNDNKVDIICRIGYDLMSNDIPWSSCCFSKLSTLNDRIGIYCANKDKRSYIIYLPSYLE